MKKTKLQTILITAFLLCIMLTMLTAYFSTTPIHFIVCILCFLLLFFSKIKINYSTIMWLGIIALAMTTQVWSQRNLKTNLGFLVGILFFIAMKECVNLPSYLINKRTLVICAAICCTMYLGTIGIDLFKHGITKNDSYVVLFSFICCAYTWWFISNKKLKYLLVFVFYLSALLTTSRSNIVTIPFSIALAFFLMNVRKKNFSSKVFRAFFICLFLVTFAYIVCEITQPVAYQRFMTSVNYLLAGEDISNGRSYFYGYAISDIKDNFWFGTGWLSFSTIHRLSASSTFDGAHVHNIYLQVMSENGLLGIILFFTPIISSLITTITTLRSSLINEYQSKVLLLSLSVQIYYLLSSAFHATAWEYVYIIVFFFAITLAYSVKSSIMHKNICII